MCPFLTTGKPDVFSLLGCHGQLAPQAGNGGYQLFHKMTSFVERISAS